VGQWWVTDLPKLTRKGQSLAGICLRTCRASCTNHRCR
jgi:hypothetical protein